MTFGASFGGSALLSALAFVFAAFAGAVAFFYTALGAADFGFDDAAAFVFDAGAFAAAFVAFLTIV